MPSVVRVGTSQSRLFCAGSAATLLTTPDVNSVLMDGVGEVGTRE
jgi:hypothetical protein